jgi:hypothetical protein
MRFKKGGGISGGIVIGQGVLLFDHTLKTKNSPYLYW